MAKDDYYVIVCKVLVYLYGVFKRKIVFDEMEFRASLLKGGIDEDYLISILNMMQDDGYIKGLNFKTAWGCEILLINDLDNMKITSKGIDYLLDNNKMKSVLKFLVENVDIFASLIIKLLPI